jgi:lipopolysaccharide export system permease protein
MFTRLDRYVAAQVLSAVFVILLVVVGLDIIFEFVDQTEDLNDTYQIGDLLYYLGLRIPSQLYEFMPLASLIGALVGLGMLASHSELPVMRAAGISISRIVISVLKPALLLAVAALLLGEFVVPKTEQIAESSRALAQSGGKALQSKHGIWHRQDNQFIHINAVDLEGTIFGITRFDFDESNRLISTSFAEQGRFTGDGWDLKNIQRTRLFEDHTEVDEQLTEHWVSGLTPTLLSVIVVEPVDLSISGLWAYTRYLGEQGLNATQYKLAFWSKVLQPAGILALVLVAISFVFGPLRSVTVGQRVIAGVVVGLIFKFSQDLLSPASAILGFTPLLASLIPILICFAVGLLLLRRAS